MSTLSVITITRNEEKNIAACLESVRWADEVIVIDSGSSDRTVEIARQYTPHVFTGQWRGYGETRNEALTKVRNPWVLWLDADERVTPELAEEVRQVLSVADESIAGYSVARRAYFLGRWIKHAGWYPGRVVRLFRTNAGRFSTHRVHERLELQGRSGELRNDLLHFTDPDLRHYFEKFNLYTSLAAEDMHTEGRRFRLSDLLVRPVFTFFRMYIVRRGFLDGIEGLILCAVSSAYVFVKYAKLWERSTKSSSSSRGYYGST